MGYEAIREQTLARQKEHGHRPAGHRAAAAQPDRHAGDAHRPGRQAVPRRWTTPGPGTRCQRRRAAAVPPDGRGLRGLPRPRRPPHRAAARLPGGDRPAGQHAGHPRLRQRRLRRGRPERLGQREQVRPTASPTTSPRTSRKLDDLGGPKTYNHYPTGWAMAFNTPFKMWKRYEFNGGTADPCIISWPTGMRARGEIRAPVPPRRSTSCPTMLDVLGVEPPDDDQGAHAEPRSTA